MTARDASVQRSFIKWVGGKNKSIKNMLPMFPRHYDRYFEPFMGSCVVHLNEQHSPAFLSDVERPLVETVQAVQGRCDDVCTELELLDNTEQDYYKTRVQFNERELFTPKEAAMFIYLNKCGYNGLYRVNSSGKFNGPYGKRTGQPHRDYPILRNCSALLAGAVINHSGYATAISNCSKGDFIYLDPPYYKVSEGSYTSYNKDQFTHREHELLKEFCSYFSKKGVLFAMSNSDCEPVRQLFKDFRIREVNTTRSVSSGANRGAHVELFICNY